MPTALFYCDIFIWGKKVQALTVLMPVMSAQKIQLLYVLLQ